MAKAGGTHPWACTGHTARRAKAYLRGGLREHGFVRVRCDASCVEHLLDHSAGAIPGPAGVAHPERSA